MTGSGPGAPDPLAEAWTLDASTLLLGRDHATWGEFTLVETGGGRSAAALSVGTDPTSPSMSSKGSRMYPNEDALLVVEDGSRTLVAVADAHHGHRASHALLEALSGRTAKVPTTPDELARSLAGLGPLTADPDSGTTLLVAIHDRETASGFGMSFGDSSVVLVDDAGARWINLRRPQYLRAMPELAIDPADGLGFAFRMPPRALLAAFTDGIDECHYRSPETSVGADHLASLFAKTGPAPRRFAAALVELALQGVEGHPGGQDNIALVVTAPGPENPR